MKKLLIVVLLAIPFLGNTQTESVEKNCNFRIDEVDDFTGNLKRVLHRENFVRHTDSLLMKYYKKNDYDFFEIELNVGRVNDLYAVYWNILVRSKSGYEYYGAIYKDAKVIFKLENGTTLETTFATSDTGKTDYDKNTTKYSSFIILEDHQMQILDKVPVTKIRVYWSKGYEDYEVDSPNLLVNQLNCFY